MELIIQLLINWSVKLLGFGIGMCIPLLDLIPLIMFPKKENLDAAAAFRVESKSLARKFRFVRLFRLWKSAVENESRLMTHRKVIFLAVFVVFATFVITSTGSVFGVAVVAGFSSMVALQLLPDIQNPTKLRQRFFSDLAVTATNRTAQGLGVAWILLSLLSIYVLVMS